MNGGQGSPKVKAALLAGALLLLTPAGRADAADASRITVDNQHSATLMLNLFNGDDVSCVFEEKRKTVGANSEKTVGCSGGGKKRCKVQVKIRDDLTTACRQSSEVRKCGSVNVMVVNDGEILTVLEDASDCEITKP
jgi:hypothetical protein